VVWPSWWRMCSWGSHQTCGDLGGSETRVARWLVVNAFLGQRVNQCSCTDRTGGSLRPKNGPPLDPCWSRCRRQPNGLRSVLGSSPYAGFSSGTFRRAAWPTQEHRQERRPDFNGRSGPWSANCVLGGVSAFFHSRSLGVAATGYRPGVRSVLVSSPGSGPLAPQLSASALPTQEPRQERRPDSNGRAGRVGRAAHGAYRTADSARQCACVRVPR
jgi:hypothetical protein